MGEYQGQAGSRRALTQSLGREGGSWRTSVTSAWVRPEWGCRDHTETAVLQAN